MSGPNYHFDKEKIMAEVRRRTQAALALAAVDVQTAIRQELNQSGSGMYGSASPPGSPPGRRTGELAGSVQIDASELQSNLRVKIGTRKTYARIQEMGGIVMAKGKLLTVPLNREAIQLRKSTSNLRTLALKVIPVGAKRFLARMVKGKAKFLFALVPSVFLPARPFMRPALRKVKEKVLSRFRNLTGGIVK